jgi:hypothetical protein
VPGQKDNIDLAKRSSQEPAMAGRSQRTEEANLQGHGGKCEQMPWQGPLPAPRISPKLAIGDAIAKASIRHGPLQRDQLLRPSVRSAMRRACPARSEVKGDIRSLPRASSAFSYAAILKTPMERGNFNENGSRGFGGSASGRQGSGMPL